MTRFSVLVVTCFLLSAGGCKGLKEQLEQKARENSLRKSAKSEAATSLTNNGCPAGSTPAAIDANGKATVCSSGPYDGRGREHIDQNWPNGNPKVRYVVAGDSLEVTHFHPNGMRKEQTSYLANQKHGLWQEWHASGELKSSAEYRNGKRNGAFASYSAKGSPEKTGSYLNDLEQGLWVTYGARGQVASRETFSRGVKHGNAEYLTPEGKIKEHGAYQAGKRVGRWIAYYPDGQRRSEGSYRDGKQDGRWLEYAPDNRSSRKMYYKNGQLVQKQTLRGEVEFNQGDILGAEPPLERKQTRKRTPPVERGAQPLTEGRGWKPL
ncbi:MAG: toxin-antitoxin system YwqK family antitoxin [Bdellovibrionales bacterium]|nr:toxin-antitoxin system YwqK family antitoxin [Bdellovibrionales bacterium]